MGRDAAYKGGETLAQMCDRAVGTMPRIFSIIIATIKCWSLAFLLSKKKPIDILSHRG
jgi:hypothetical protein